jgi:hypothetical protein
MLNLRELMTELILFAYDEDELMARFCLTAAEVSNLSDVDLLELYDQTLMSIGSA